MNERKINYSDLVLRPGDSAETINEKLITEQLENIFSYDQAVEILSEFEKNGIQAGMAKQLEVLLANKEEYETAIGENQDKKEIIVENDNPNPENIRGYDEAVAQSREELRKINEQIAVLEKGLEEMNNTQNPETNSPATEERAPEEPQNTTASVTPTPEEPRVVEETPIENNPEIVQNEVSHVVPVRRVQTRVINEIPSHVARNTEERTQEGPQNGVSHVVPVRKIQTRVINEIPSHVARNTEERTPEEPQNTTVSVTPPTEEPRVVEATPVENNPATTQDTTDSNDWKNNPNDYRTILGEIEKSENELRHLNYERDALIAAQRSMSEASYQREMSTIERFLAREQLKLDQNRNLANNYEAAYSLLKDLDGLTGQPDNSRDAQDRREREEEITAKRKELASHMDELTDTLATEVRNRVLSERANRNNTAPQVLVAEAERQIRERGQNQEPPKVKEITPLSGKTNTPTEQQNPEVRTQDTDQNAIPSVTSATPTSGTSVDSFEQAQNDYNQALKDYQQIVADEADELDELINNGPYSTMEELDRINNKYMTLKKETKEKIIAASKRMEEARAKTTEQQASTSDVPRDTSNENGTTGSQTPENNAEPDFSLLGLPAAGQSTATNNNNKKTEPTGSQTPENNAEPDFSLPGLPPHKEPEKQKQPENNETKVKKGLYTIMEELTNGLELTRKMNGKYTASNIKVVKGFKEELKSGNVLYNIVHFVPAVVAMPINFVRKVVNKLTYSMKERENVEKFKDRLSKLSQEDLETIWNEYRGTRVIQERYTGIVNTLLNEKMQEYAATKVAVLDKKIAGEYRVLFSAMQQVEACDELLKTETDPRKIRTIKQERANLLAGKAEMISNLRSQYIEANQILNGGAHGFAEDMKAARTKLSIVGKRFAKDHDFNNELAAKQAEIEKRENAAIANGDDEKALRAFVDGEVLLMGKTEIKKTLFGQQSVGEKYSMPLVDMLNYCDDPFVRDLLRTVAYVGMGISVANALITHGPKSDALLQQNKADTDRVNAANDATIEQVHQAGDTLTGNRDDFITGMQSQTGETSVNISQSLERETLDSNSWYLGTEYNKMDAFNHARYNAMSDAAKAKLEDIATKCYNNQITDMQALEMIKEVANTQHQNLIDIYTEYQPILEQYASTHPFDLHGVQESMQFVLDHPDAVIKMNEGMVESIQVGEELAGLSAEHIAAINSLPSDLATTLFGTAASIAALTHQAATTMSNNVKSGKYGNKTTDMIQAYIDSKAKASEAPEEKSSGSGKSR